MSRMTEARLRAVEEEEWSRELIEAAVSNAPQKSLAVLRSLARRPEEWLSVDEIAQGMPTPDGRASSDARSIGGALGGLARQAKRLGMKRILDVRFDRTGQRNQYRMDGRVAALVTEQAHQAQMDDDVRSVA